MNARLILTTSCLLLLPCAEAAEWEKLPSLPEPNGGFVVGVDQGKVVIAGGTNWEGGQKNWLKKVRAFAPNSLKWETRADLDRATAYAVTGTRSEAMKKSIMVFAGGANAEGALPFVQFLGKDGLEAKPAILPTNVVVAAGGVHVNSMVFCGGTPNAAEIEKASNTTWSIDLDTMKVTSLAAFPGPPFVTAASTMDFFGRLLVFGGGTWDARTKTVINMDAAHVYDVNKNTWKKLRTLPYAVRGISAAMLYQDKPKGGSTEKSYVYLAGGYKNDTDGFTDEAFIYDIDKDEYRPAAPLPYKAMVSLVVCEGYLYCLGGEDKKQSRSDACYRIRLEDLLK